PESGLEKQDDDDLTFLNEDHTILRSHRIDIKFAGGNSSPEIIGTNPTGTLFNFYTSNLPGEGITGVQSYNQVTYKNIYPGIDLIFSVPDEVNDIPLEYRWIVHPGADASRIKVQYSGEKALTLNPDGTIKLTASSGSIEEGKVFAFLEDDLMPVN